MPNIHKADVFFYLFYCAKRIGEELGFFFTTKSAPVRNIPFVTLVLYMHTGWIMEFADNHNIIVGVNAKIIASHAICELFWRAADRNLKCISTLRFNVPPAIDHFDMWSLFTPGHVRFALFPLRFFREIDNNAPLRVATDGLDLFKIQP